MPTFYGPPSDGTVIPEQLETALAADVGAPESPIGGALRAQYQHKRSAGPQTIVKNVGAYQLGAQSPTTWVTYDGSGVVVHPSVRYFPEGFNGYRWWAAATPYAGADNQLENPSIFVSHNGSDWIAPPGVTNPLWPAQTGGYNSDTHLTQGPDGKLYLMFRDFSTVESPTEKLRMMESADGITWTTPVTALGHVSTDKRLVSPAFWYDPAADEWVMLAVDILPDQRPVLRYTATSPYGPWTLGAESTYDLAWGAGRSPWHIDAMPLGSQVVSVVHEAAADGAEGGLYLAVSNDAGRTFTRSFTALVTSGAYRSALLPVLSERGLALDVWVGKHGGTWGVSRAVAAPPAGASGGALEPWQLSLLEIQAASKPTDPFTLGDTFDRADDATGLGVATSGQAWAASAGTMQILNGQAIGTAAANQRVSIDAGIADMDVKVRVTTTGVTGAQAFLIARFQDSNNYIRVGYTGMTFQVTVVKAGGVTTPISLSSRKAAVHDVRVRCVGDKVSAYEDGVLIGTATIADFVTATNVGLQTTVATIPFDNLTVRRP